MKVSRAELSEYAKYEGHIVRLKLDWSCYPDKPFNYFYGVLFIGHTLDHHYYIEMWGVWGDRNEGRSVYQAFGKDNILECRLIHEIPKLIHKPTKETEMNEFIVNAFPSTKDAILIDKHFGQKTNDPLFALLVKGKENALLKEAQRLEKLESKKKV